MRVVFVVAALLALCSPAYGAGADSVLRGFSSVTSARERADEARFLAIPSASGALSASRAIDARAHYAGSAGDYALAVYMRDRLRDYGFNASLEVVRARIDTPIALVLALQPRTGVGLGLSLAEAPSPVDPGPGRPDAGLPFNYGSGDGDVVAPLIYANRGLDADYATLAAAGVNPRGAVVIVRYGAQYRGELAVRAQNNGAAGVIFYCDPKDDGYARGPVYPNGPWRPDGSTQRGAVSREPLRIPTLPVTADNARILLGAISGVRAPPNWQGALPLTYQLGRSTVPVHLTVRMQRRIGDLWNTVGVIAGSKPGASVILGGHRDAWVYGVTDNGSGISTLLEAARGIGALYRHGRRPLRSIVIAGWDGEEIGEVGSHAYVAAHADRLRSSAVAYVNADEVVVGPHFTADAAAAIGPEFVAVTHDVTDAGAKRSVFAAWKERQPDVPGGGSDHEAFLFGLGTPTLNLAYDGPFGVYHSAYDDLRYAVTQTDPGFTRHRAVAQLLGVTALRLANATAVPYTFAPYAAALKRASRDLVARAGGVQLPIDVAPLDGAIARFARVAPHFDARTVTATPGLDAAALSAVQSLDKCLYGALGYEAVAFPAITSAIDARNPSATKAAIAAAAAAIGRATTSLSTGRS